MSDRGLFGGLFDFNGDGKLDSFEKPLSLECLCKCLTPKKMMN